MCSLTIKPEQVQPLADFLRENADDKEAALTWQFDGGIYVATTKDSAEITAAGTVFVQ